MADDQDVVPFGLVPYANPPRARITVYPRTPEGFDPVLPPPDVRPDQRFYQWSGISHLMDPATYRDLPPPTVTPNDQGKLPQSDPRVIGGLADVSNVAQNFLPFGKAAAAVPVFGALSRGLAREAPAAESALAKIGHNMPPEEFRLRPEDMAPEFRPDDMAPFGSLAPPPSWAAGLPRPRPAASSTEIPNIRGLPVDEAIAIARRQPHLIEAGDISEGKYIGGPRNIQSKAALNKIRNDFDAYVAADPRGGDWYDRYRAGVNRVTGGDPVQNQWMTAQEGQWSAGVDPGSELHFALKENNASIAGMPIKAARPAQHEAHLAAIAAKDPSLYQLGDKTGEYASQVNPDRPGQPGATGVNDFRHAINFKYTEPNGAPQRNALTDAAHRFLDMETALAVDRANRANLGGRSNWTGEQLQAAPWVRQKALDIQGRNPALTYDQAVDRANRTITDYFPEKEYYATHEAQPGYDVTGHMPGAGTASQAERQAFFGAPGSSWATAPGGRDAIYSGLGIQGTGNYMRVEPTIPMQGMYRRPDGTLETNPGAVARPLGTFATGGKGEPFKRATDADQAILNSGEALRGYMDAQNAAAWHKLWFGGPAKESNTLFYPSQGKGELSHLFDVQGTNTKVGLPDVADTGQGITSTSFWPPPEGGAAFDKALKEGALAHPDLGAPRRARLDGNMIDYVDQWKAGEGSGEATRKMLSYVEKTPELRAAFNNNPYLAQQALDKFDRDKTWAAKWGAPREDIQNARKIIGAGPGWIDRMQDALKTGAISLPAFGALLAGSAATQHQQEAAGHGGT